MAMSIAMTTNVYGLLSASLTIHMGLESQAGWMTEESHGFTRINTDPVQGPSERSRFSLQGNPRLSA
jgi:hypothetical protein